MIRVAIVDDHHAVRLGLNAAFESEPGLVPVGTATKAAELSSLLYRSRPDIVLLDYNLPDGDDLTVCHGLKSQALARSLRGDPRSRGGTALPPNSKEYLQVAAAALDEQDLPILGMLIAATPVPEIVDTLRIELSLLRRRMGRCDQRGHARNSPP